MRIGAVAAHFGRDLDRAVAKLGTIIDAARADGVDLLVLPDATLGGYLGSLRDPRAESLPPVLSQDDAVFEEIATLAGDMVVCLGYTELVGGGSLGTGSLGGGPVEEDVRHNAAVCLSGDGVLGRHRKVHQPLGESLVHAPGDRFDAFGTPLGRLGMLIDYDKTFPESARALALDGAEVVACLSAWPASTTDRASRLPQDRQSRLFDLYDSARAAENQVVWASSNQTGVLGGLRFLGQAKVVGPGGDVLARTWSKGGIAVADVDVAHEVGRSRRVLHHLAERRVDVYRTGAVGGVVPGELESR